jgi:hypothetical protein
MSKGEWLITTQSPGGEGKGEHNLSTPTSIPRQGGGLKWVIFIVEDSIPVVENYVRKIGNSRFFTNCLKVMNMLN